MRHVGRIQTEIVPPEKLVMGLDIRQVCAQKLRQISGGASARGHREDKMLIRHFRHFLTPLKSFALYGKSIAASGPGNPLSIVVCAIGTPFKLRPWNRAGLSPVKDHCVADDLHVAGAKSGGI